MVKVEKTAKLTYIWFGNKSIPNIVWVV